MKVDLAKRREVMERSMRLGHCICEPRRPCPCDVFRDQGFCPCAGERPDPVDLSQLRLTQWVRNAGCASKIAPGDLEAVLARLPPNHDPKVLSGLAAGDDAAIYRLTDDLCLVQTVDVFTPCVDEPVLFGKICAANCLSDIYAMGGEPRTALSILAFPSETLQGEVMYRMLAGAMHTLADAGVSLIGGHSIKDDEIKLGFAITGVIDPAVAQALDQPRVGDVLLLTKPLGTGVLAFAQQVGRGHDAGYAAAAESMAALNRSAAEVMRETGASAATDITGFGLFAHLIRLLRQHRLTARIESETLPDLPGALELLRQEVIPGAIERNREFVGAGLEVEPGVDTARMLLGFDAQGPQGQLPALMTRDGIEDDVMGWDWRYYTEQVRAERFDLDESEVKAYLDLDNMIAAQFYVAERLFGVRFTERTDIETYHDDVRVWEVTRADGGEVVGLFYGDYFARPGKRSGAWMSSFRPQNGITGDIPIIINNCNYNRPAEGAPALISFTDATTLFHELGHGLHGLLSNTEYPSLAGTSVDRDFVEFHAQVMEHWFAEPEVLERFALHYETGEPMPRELLDRVLEAQTFNQGFSTVEFLNSGLVDMAYHRHIDPTSIDVEAFEAEVLARYGSPQAIPMRHRSTHFLHVFSGEGYASGYYSYLWAGVLDNDGFDAFVEAGDIFDPETAARLRAVFSSGNTIPAMDNFINFRGREPSVEPLLRSRGFIEAEG